METMTLFAQDYVSLAYTLYELLILPYACLSEQEAWMGHLQVSYSSCHG